MEFKNDKYKHLRDSQGRYRKGMYWTTEAYEEDIDIDTLKKLLVGFEYLISPLHNLDKFIDGDNAGQLKKAHWHIVFWNTCAISPTGYFKLIDNSCLKGLDKVDDINRYLHYLLHEGYNYELTGKHEYNYNEFISSSSYVNYSQFFQLDATDVNILALCDFIDNNCLTTFRSVVNFLRSTGNQQYLKILFGHPYFFKCYLS